ncbi:MAG: hypothetical protein ABSC92_16645 [Rhizomicrobium sp.]|jgi:hypothetical protein
MRRDNLSATGQFCAEYTAKKFSSEETGKKASNSATAFKNNRRNRPLFPACSPPVIRLLSAAMRAMCEFRNIVDRRLLLVPVKRENDGVRGAVAGAMIVLSPNPPSPMLRRKSRIVRQRAGAVGLRGQLENNRRLFCIMCFVRALAARFSFAIRKTLFNGIAIAEAESMRRIKYCVGLAHNREECFAGSMRYCRLGRREYVHRHLQANSTAQ